MRQQSLTYYFPTKQALLDALFADGFADLRRRFDELGPSRDPVSGVVEVASHAVALSVLQELVDRLSAAGVTRPADVDLVRSVMSGIVAEQIATVTYSSTRPREPSTRCSTPFAAAPDMAAHPTPTSLTRRRSH